MTEHDHFHRLAVLDKMCVAAEACPGHLRMHAFASGSWRRRKFVPEARFATITRREESVTGVRQGAILFGYMSSIFLLLCACMTIKILTLLTIRVYKVIVHLRASS
eukprot:6187270-Pleurochrysis_carterae.AAC.2